MRPLRLFLDGFGSYRQPTEADFSDVELLRPDRADRLRQEHAD